MEIFILFPREFELDKIEKMFQAQKLQITAKMFVHLST
jgi:hypothetical protein